VPPVLELVATLHVTVDPPLEAGPLPAGERRVIPITGGTVDGPQLRGVVLPGGADWNTRLPSGHSHVWARYTIRTHDGVLLGVINDGHGAWSDGRFLAYTHPRLEAPAGPYAVWNTVTMLGTVEATGPGAVDIRWYRPTGA
jgi:Protein of unknown function (DUF3237)